ncbi:ABC transporter ATP-binding protein [Salinarimonas ramus]|uniref:ABC transporter ATP-binding protein n=1 Tax=Salinarimonas ramus TaxID=690164 RepID=A0A917V1Q4_9HYPH|nr:ABC transporter ATP-binding protein [Salinarimonas ramus]GGK17579.1 ABC transporter ATP-binding protein [Salinarimonas ramus]
MRPAAHAHPAPPPAGADDFVIRVEGLEKTYASGFKALETVDLAIRRGEIFALLGENGAGKSTLIGAICGLVRPSGGRILVDGHDAVADYRAVRAKIGLVPQELHVDSFERVMDTVAFSRGLFGKPRDPAFIEGILRELSLWEKRNDKIIALSGGMKRRLLIAKALAHEPTILFLDEPSAGVDVELRREMWQMVHRLRARGVTIILTTHYIEEAEEMADRVGVINKGEILLVEEKTTLMRKLGRRELTLHLREPLAALPDGVAGPALTLAEDGRSLTYVFDSQSEDTGIAGLLRSLAEAGIEVRDLATSESSLEEIFVSLVRGRPQ